MGLLVGTVFYPVISTTRRHKSIMWCFRIAAIPLAVILYVVLVRNFYTADPYAGELSSHPGQLHILMIPILSLFWVSLLVVHPEGCKQSLQRVCVSSVYLIVLIFIFSRLLEPGSPPLMVDLLSRVPVYLDYCLLDSDLQRHCTILRTVASFTILVSSTLCPRPMNPMNPVIYFV